MNYNKEEISKATVEPTSTPLVTVTPVPTGTPVVTSTPIATAIPATAYPSASTEAPAGENGSDVVNPTLPTGTPGTSAPTGTPETSAPTGTSEASASPAVSEEVSTIVSAAPVQTSQIEKKFFEVKEVRYQKRNAYEYTVCGVTNKKIKKVVIPDTILVDGKLYKVTLIQKNAFKNLKKLTSVKIGAYVSVVESGAFANTRNLKKIIFGKNLVRLGKKGLYHAKKLKWVRFQGVKLKKIGVQCFRGVNKKVKIQVPPNRKKRYQKLIKKAI